MHKGFLKTATLLGALSVAFGAFAAHSLKQHVSDYAVGIFETGVRYQFYHAFALLAAGILKASSASMNPGQCGVFRRKTSDWSDPAPGSCWV